MNEKYPLSLPEGTVLAGQYIIERVLGQGGFGITYEAEDHKTGGRVAVKEFFPDSMATRTNQTTVSPFSGERGESFAYGKTCFLQEAETLARFIGNENIVRIHSYFEENGTAYFVMDFIEGTSFDEYLKERGGKISFDDAAGILIPVMDALNAVHSQGIVHRDVTPDNIYITKEGVVKLLDFGAARYSLGDKSRSLDVILKHGFAPKEQYTRRGRQGPYTDVYALGATFYFALTGRRPPDSVERMDEDDLVPPSSLGVQLSAEAEDAILQALSVQPSDRFQSMAAFKNALQNLQQDEAAEPVLAAVGATVSQTYFSAPDQSSIPRSAPVSAPGQDADLQDLAATMKNAGKLAGKLAGKMAGQLAEKTAETAGVVAGTAGKMSEIVAAKKAETSERLAAKIAKSKEEKAAKQAVEDSPEDLPADTAEMPVRSTAKPKSKRPLVLAAVALVILLGIFILKPGGSDSNSTPGGSTNKTNSSEPSSNTPSGNAPDDTPGTGGSNSNAAAALPGDFTMVGNNSANIMNDGLITADSNGNSYWISDNNGSLYSEAEERYITYYGALRYFDLSFDSGKLYYRHGYNVYAYNPDTQEEEDVPYLTKEYSGDIVRLFLTTDYYVIARQNRDKTVTVCLVSRSDGQAYECCTVQNKNLFTISDDGQLYYVDSDMSVQSMDMATLTQTGALAQSNSSDYKCTFPVVAGKYLYFFVYSEKDKTDYALFRVNRTNGQDLLSWQISSKLDLSLVSPDAIGINVNRKNNQDVFFYLSETESSNSSLFHLKIYTDGSFDAQQMQKNSKQANIVYLTSGNFKVNYLSWDYDRSGYKLYYNTFDQNGNSPS